MELLFVIAARGESKGIPKKNIKPLAQKPLLYYSIDVARNLVSDEKICLSTDDAEIIACAEKYGLKAPFVRPAELATDTAGANEVIMHALDFYTGKRTIDAVVLLQPTSPFRLVKHVKGCIDIFEKNIDAVMSVKETDANPYNLLYDLDKEGFLKKILDKGNYERRQDTPKVYQLNGAVYVYNAESLRKNKISDFKRIRHYEMPALNSVDIDTPLDWAWAEFLLEKKLISFDYEQKSSGNRS